jgi:hypothetical protein
MVTSNRPVALSKITPSKYLLCHGRAGVLDDVSNLLADRDAFLFVPRHCDEEALRVFRHEL